MKLKHLAVLVLVAIATTANAGLAFGSTDVSSSSQGDVVSGVKAVNRYFKKRPTQKHPTLLQDASGSFCLAYGLSRSGRTKPQAKINKPVKPTEPTDPTSPTDPPTVNGGDPPTQPTAGNGGVNGGHDTNKPPFPGKGPKGK